MVHADAAVARRRSLRAATSSGTAISRGRLAGELHLVRDALGLTAHVREDQRRAHVARQARTPCARTAAAAPSRRRTARRRRAGSRAVRGSRRSRTRARCPAKIRRDALERRDGRRQPDAPERDARELFERFEHQRELRAALVAGQRVHFVDDDGLDVRERLAVRFHREHQRERFRRRDQHVRRPRHASAAAPRPACRRCARRSARTARGCGRAAPARARCSAARAAPSRAAAGAGCARRRSRARAAARRRGSTCAPAARRRRAAPRAAT